MYCFKLVKITSVTSVLIDAGYPLFPGENEVEQLACIMEILGLPPNIVLEQATRRRLFFGKWKTLQQLL